MKTLGNITLFNFSSVDPAIVSGSSFTYRARMVHEDGTPLSSADLSSLTLSIIAGGLPVPGVVGTIINGVSNVNILNTDRGAIDTQGNLLVVLIPGDTFSELPPVDRSLIFNWVYGVDNRVGRHQVVFRIVRLSGDT